MNLVSLDADMLFYRAIFRAEHNETCLLVPEHNVVVEDNHIDAAERHRIAVAFVQFLNLVERLDKVHLMILVVVVQILLSKSIVLVRELIESYRLQELTDRKVVRPRTEHLFVQRVDTGYIAVTG